MMEALHRIETTPISVFVREDFYAYFVLLILHAWGMALLVGGGIVLALRLMGVASGARLEAFSQLAAWMKLGAVLAIVSGLGLLVGYPAKALTNWVFAVKFACLAGAALLARQAMREAMPAAAAGNALQWRSKKLAAASLLLWLGGVACGKLLLYTNTILLSTD